MPPCLHVVDSTVSRVPGAETAVEWSLLCGGQPPLKRGGSPKVVPCLSSHFQSLLFLLSYQSLPRWPMRSWGGNCSALVQQEHRSLTLTRVRLQSDIVGGLCCLCFVTDGCRVKTVRNGRKECHPRKLLVPLLMQPSRPPWVTQGLEGLWREVS